MLACVLILTAWFSFIVSLCLPAFTLRIDGIDQLLGEPAPFPGWIAAIICGYFWPANVILLFGPVALCVPIHRWLGRAVAILLILSAFGSVAFFNIIEPVHSGYWCWLATLLLMAVGFLVRSCVVGQQRTEPQSSASMPNRLEL